MIEVRRSTIAELEAAPNIAQLLAEYSAESSLPELGPTSPQVETYRQLEANGMLHPFGAFDHGLVVGFLLMTAVVLPKYGCVLAQTESWFVSTSHRATGAGLRLLTLAEALARELGAKAIQVMAPASGVLREVMGGRDYRMTNVQFTKALA